MNLWSEDRERGNAAVKWTFSVGALACGVFFALTVFTVAESAQPPTKEYPIVFDATGMEPPTFWQVPGVTPQMASNDPDSTDAYRTEQKRQLLLKPGTYTYGTWTFSFQFTVTQDGRVDYSKTLDQCVEGRGTQTLRVNCRRMYPYGGQRDY